VDLRNAAPSRLSIGYYSPGWPLAVFSNGVVTYVATLVPTLKAMGLQVTIIAGRVAEETFDESVYNPQQDQVSQSVGRRVIDGLWHRIAPRSAQRHLLRRSLSTTIRRAVLEQGIQIIEMEEAFGWAGWVRQVTSIPVCIRLHGPWILSGPALGVPEDDVFRQRVQDEGWAIRVVDAVTAPSRHVLEQVRDFYGLALPEAEVIPNPTWPVPVAQRWRLENCDPKQVLFVGRFDRHKGGDLIIEAFGRVLHDVPEARLCFVGPDKGCTLGNGRRWGLEDFVRDRVPGALESGRIEWLGRQPSSALAELRRRAMVSVVCSRWENGPYTVLEAAAMGCPTVGAKAGGIAEIIQDNVNGLLHRAEDPSDIATKIIQLLKNPAQAAEVGHQAAVDCERRYYPDVVAERLVDFYRRVISRSAPLARNQSE
jgi:glycosyltransferase involved in cell wall biosynthesis